MNTPRFWVALAIAVLAGRAAPATAQLELPTPSPRARVLQTVGLTEVEVEYGSPAARGRKVFGGLVPYDQHWRTGANANTLIRFSKPVVIDGKTVPAGRYSLHTIPGELAWTIIVNRKTDGGGSNSYEPAEDVLRLRATPREIPFRERLTFVFSNTTDDATHLDLEWATVRVRLPIAVQTAQQVEEAITKAADDAWRLPAQAARYLVDQGRDLQRALELVNQSIGVKETWLNLWVKARILGDRGEVAAARALTERALALGDASGAFAFYAEAMRKALKDWSSS